MLCDFLIIFLFDFVNSSHEITFAKKRITNMRKLIIYLVFAFTSAAGYYLHAQDLWQQLSGPYGGNINKIVSAPNGTLYAITNSAVFKSTNEGILWMQVTPSSINGLVTGAVAPNGYVYTATGSISSKIYRSTNEGLTWQEQLPDGGYDFNAMTVTPSGNIVAGTFYMFSFHGNFVQAGDIYYSTNNGNTFLQASFPNIAVISMKANVNGDIYVTTLNGLFKSVNGGASFNVVRSDTCEAVFTNPSGHVFFSTHQQVFRSTNHGASWEAVANRIPMASNQLGTLFTSEGSKIYNSTDNGENWNEIANISPASLFNINSILSVGNNKLFAGSGFGIHKSDNSGVNWTEANQGLRISNILTVTTAGNNIFTGSEKYISRSTDNGNSWSNLSNGLPVGQGTDKIVISPNGSVFTFGFGLYRSTNNGDSWVILNTSLPPGVTNGFIDINSSSEVYVSGTGKIFRSVNNGNNFTDISSGLPNDLANITGLTVNKQNNNIFISMTWGGFNTQHGVFKSTNNGASWTQLSSQFIKANFKFNSLNHIYSNTVTNLYRSTDGGMSFNIVSTTPDYVLEFEIDSQNQIFIHAVENEVYSVLKSTNNGQTWLNFTQGLGQLLINKFAFDNNSRLIAATQSGLFRTVNITGITVQNNHQPTGYILEQNYPNPFNPETNIIFSIPRNEYIELSVYNSLGEVVDILVNGNLNAGTYEYTWNASGFASGIYFYKLKTENFSTVKKMILIK
jgi:photosystem II stability/assembly factor-like uncharacterized protein